MKTDPARRAADRMRADTLNEYRKELEQIDAHEEMLRELEKVNLWFPPDEERDAA